MGRQMALVGYEALTGKSPIDILGLWRMQESLPK